VLAVTSAPGHPARLNIAEVPMLPPVCDRAFFAIDPHGEVIDLQELSQLQRKPAQPSRPPAQLELLARPVRR
jgi:hypothetical protein